jgi:hypothetical protein
MSRFSSNAVFFSWCYGLFVSTFVFVWLLVISLLMDRASAFLAWVGSNAGLVIGGIIALSVIFGFVVMMTALDTNV